MSDKRTIWEHPIIAGVSVTAIVGLAIWIFPSVQAMSKSVLAFVLGLLGTPIPLWVSLLGLVLFVAAISIERRIDRWIRKRALQRLQDRNEPEGEIIPTPGIWQATAEQPPVESPEPELDEVQKKIMHIFQRTDGDAMNPVEIGYYSKKTTQLRLKKALDDLAVIGLLRRYRLNNSYGLTPKGRDYILKGQDHYTGGTR